MYLLLAAVVIDLVFGEPRNSLHPVVWMGNAISGLLRIAPKKGPVQQFIFGSIVAACFPVLCALLTHQLLGSLAPVHWLQSLAGAFLLTSCFAVRSFGTAAYRVRLALRRGSISEARNALRHLCSRDPAHLTHEQIVGATVESIAENTTDSVVAPLFYYALFGIEGAIAYRSINTLDSRVGYHGFYEYLGKSSARLDDIVNFVPARITAALFLLSGTTLGADPRNGRRIWRRDSSSTESPNAGHTMAMMAGLLRLQLVKSGCYRLGDPEQILTEHVISQAWHIALGAMLSWFLLIVGVSLAF